MEPNQTTVPASPLLSKKEVTITDARGRTILLKRPSVLAQFRLVELLGGETSQNIVYMNMILPVVYVAEIDGEDVGFSTRRELNALITLLDEDGIDAVTRGVQEHYAPKAESADEALKK